MTTTRLYRFDRFTFNPATSELTSSGSTTKLPPQPARLLVLLLENAGHTVTHDQIRDTVWPSSFADFDQSLHSCIRRIRAALRERAGRARFIETLPRKGYRFVGEVATEDADAEPGRGSAARQHVKSWKTDRRGGFPLAVIAWLVVGTLMPTQRSHIDSVGVVARFEAVLPHLAP